jgi:hypothetical protein
MFRRKSLQKKRTIAAIAGMLMLMLAASCSAQPPLESDSPHSPGTCTECNEDTSRLQILSDANLSNSSISPNIGGPELISPSGIQNSGKLTYNWKAMGGGQSYYLVVMDNRKRVVIKQWFNAFPAKATYSLTPRKILQSGVYTWSVSCRIHGRNLLSDEMEFTVCTSLPGRATLVSPKDTIGSKNPIFVWLPVNGATEYRLKVAKAGSPNVPIFNEPFKAEDVYSEMDQTCSVGPGLLADLEEGVYYRWWVQTTNCMGEGPWSYFKDFKYAPIKPGKPSPISPSGLISTDSPTFVWTAASGATGYHLEVYNRNKSPADDFILVDEGWFDASKATKGYRCSGTLGPLPDDDPVYFWRVHAGNDAADGPWSAWRYFETICAFKPARDTKKSIDERASRIRASRQR